MRRLGKWELRMFYIARVYGSFSKDPSTKIGAVVQRPDKTTAGHGFNGLPRGVNDDHMSDRDFKIMTVIHGEENAIVNSRDATLENCRMFVWGLPCCAHCIGLAKQRGVVKISCVSERERPDWKASFDAAATVARESGVDLEIFKLEDLPAVLRDAVPPQFEDAYKINVRKP